MQFVLQQEIDIALVEKRVIRQALMLTDGWLYTTPTQPLFFGNIDRFIPDTAVPVGSVEFVQAVMRIRGIEQPDHMTYPTCLESFLRREIRHGKISSLKGDVFAKPREEVKRFTGGLLKELKDDAEFALLAKHNQNYSVWISNPVKFVSEWRYFVLNGKIIGAGRYDAGPDEAPEPSLKKVEQAVARMTDAGGPVGYALDFGVLDDGRTALVEANDAWAIGWYRGSCSPVDYAKLLHARWQEMLLNRIKPTATTKLNPVIVQPEVAIA